MAIILREEYVKLKNCEARLMGVLSDLDILCNADNATPAAHDAYAYAAQAVNDAIAGLQSAALLVEPTERAEREASA